MPQCIPCQGETQDERAQTNTEEDHVMVSEQHFHCITICQIFLGNFIVNFHFGMELGSQTYNLFVRQITTNWIQTLGVLLQAVQSRAKIVLPTFIWYLSFLRGSSILSNLATMERSPCQSFHVARLFSLNSVCITHVMLLLAVFSCGSSLLNIKRAFPSIL